MKSHDRTRNKISCGYLFGFVIACALFFSPHVATAQWGNALPELTTQDIELIKKKARVEMNGISVHDYEGSWTDMQFLLEHRTFEHVGFGGGLNVWNFDIDAEDDDLRGSFKSRWNGWLIYTMAYF